MPKKQKEKTKAVKGPPKDYSAKSNAEKFIDYVADKVSIGTRVYNKMKKGKR